MRTIQGLPVFIFFALTGIAFSLAMGLFLFIENQWGLWQGSEVLSLAAFVFSYLGFQIICYRLFFYVFGSPQGEIPKGSWQETLAMVYQLYLLFLWRPLFQTRLVPVPLSRLVYISLGSQVGPGTYFPGTVGDPLHFSIGMNSILGEDSLVIAHAIEGERLAFYPVQIGNRVTVGAKAIIMAGVKIEDGAIVAAGSIVPKHTHIGAGEVWAGTPAKRLDSLRASA